MNVPLSEKIIDEIKKRGIMPRPRWQFLLKNRILWLFALLSVVLGGISIALIIFAFIDHDATTRVYLNESIFEDLLRTIPYFWLATLIILVGITKYIVRLTKFGYRYTTVGIVGLALCGSVFFGTLLHVTESAERIEDFLVARTPYYDEITYTSEDKWSHPEKGLLGGTITAIPSAEELEITDFNGQVWLVDFESIDDSESLVQKGRIVKIIGTQEDASTFRAARVFPWK